MLGSCETRANRTLDIGDGGTRRGTALSRGCGFGHVYVFGGFVAVERVFKAAGENGRHLLNRKGPQRIDDSQDGERVVDWTGINW